MYKTSKKSQTKNQYHHNEHSIDNFMKNIRRYNIKSQRYLSPKPLLYMYNHQPQHYHTNYTLQRSRTLSNRKSYSKRTNRTFRKKVQHILTDHSENAAIKVEDSNPGQKIQEYSRRIRKVQKYLNNKSKLGSMLCHNFLNMLNQIVQNMVLHMDEHFKDIQQNLAVKIHNEITLKYKKQLQQLKNYSNRMEKKLSELFQKQNINTKLIGHLRKLNQIDIDNQFGKAIYNINDLGGRGYHKEQVYDSQISKYQDQQQQQLQQYQHQKQSSYRPIFYGTNIEEASHRSQNRIINQQISPTNQKYN